MSCILYRASTAVFNRDLHRRCRGVFALVAISVGVGFSSIAASEVPKAPPRLATSDDLQGYEWMGLADFILTDDGSQIIVGGAVRDTRDWRGQDVDSNEYFWRLSGLTTTDGQFLVGSATYRGKSWLGLRKRTDVSGELLYQIPKDFSGAEAIAVSPDRKGVYWMLTYELQRERAQPKDDQPVTEDLNLRLRVSKHYAAKSDFERIPKLYPGAYAERTRNFIVYLDTKTRQMRGVLVGNDVSHVAIDASGRKLFAVQVKSSKTETQQEDLTTFADVYVVNLPAIDKMPIVDLMKDKETNRNAGWLDHQRMRIAPALKDIGVSVFNRTGVSWSPDGGKIAWTELGRNHTGDVWVYDSEAHRSTNLTSKIDLSGLAARVPEPLAAQFSRPYRRFGNESVSAHWLPGGQGLLVPARGYLWRVPVDGSPAENLSKNSGPIGIAKVIAESAGGRIAYSRSAEEVLVQTTDANALQDGIAWFNLRTGAMKPLVDKAGSMTAVQADTKSQMLYFASIFSNKPRQIYQLPVAGATPGTAKQLTEFQKELAQLRLPEKRLISFTTKSGRKGWGRLYLPARDGTARKWPLVIVREPLEPSAADLPPRTEPVLEHWSSVDFWRAEGVQAFNRETELFNSAGYAVLYFDIPLTPQGEYEDIRKFVVEAYDAATDAVSATGLVDPAKLALWASAWDSSGLFELMAVADRSRYKAAALFEGYGSMESDALSNSHGEVLDRYFEGRMAATFVDRPERYLAASPLSYMRGLKTPILAMHSDHDEWVLPARTEEIFNAIQPTGVRSVAAFYNKTDWWPTEDMILRAIFWFDEHLFGAPPRASRATLPDARTRVPGATP